MKDRKILVITHGDFGIELIKSVEMIMGPQDYMTGLGLRPGESVDVLREQAFDIVQKNAEAGGETIVCCDLFGGSPSNVALSCLGKADCQVILGVNMPMLIQLVQDIADVEDINELVKGAMEAATAGVQLKNRANLLNK